ncbi:MAG: hypothetical protein P1V81_12550 [Planctomycetota bacterium]|nr:hypothetical protein [Planctomycetota bacterium]
MNFCLQTAWRDLTRRLAVLAAAGAGLLSLVMDAPVITAALRGAAAYVALLVVAKIGALGMASTSARAKAPETPDPVEVER